MTNHSGPDWKAFLLRFETLLIAVLLAEIFIFRRRPKTSRRLETRLKLSV